MSNRVAIISLLLLLGYTKVSFAQTSASAHQTVVLQLNPIIQFENVSQTGIDIHTSPNNNSNPEFKVSSNARFVVSAKTIYGADDNQLVMATNISKNHEPISRQDIILNGNRGSEQFFANNKVSRKSLKSDNNALAVVYTATEP